MYHPVSPSNPYHLLMILLGLLAGLVLSESFINVPSILNHTDSRFLFTVIIPIYNTENYLEAAIFSVLNQTIGYQKIEVILVNDGSTDNSERICLRIMNLYPDNVFYFYSDHRGASAARNIGLINSHGKYLNFLDSDDLWALDAFEKVYSFFEQNYNQIDVVAARLRFLDVTNKYHPLDYKFSRTRVINLQNNFDCIQLSGASSFIKASAIGSLRFCEELIVSEDFLFLNMIILKTCRLGVVKGANYYYRRQVDGGSLLQRSRLRPSFYTKTITLCNKYLMDLSVRLYGKVCDFIQFAVMYDLQWRIKEGTLNVLDLKEKDEYIEHIKNLLVRINDNIILIQRNMNIREKLICLSEKYGYDIRNNVTFSSDCLWFNKHFLVNITQEPSMIDWVFLDVKDSILYMEGKDLCWLPDHMRAVSVVCGEQEFEASYRHYAKFDTTTLLTRYIPGRVLTLKIPLEKKERRIMRFTLTIMGNPVNIRVAYGKFTHLGSFPHGYYATPQWMIRRTGLVLEIYERTIWNHLKLETQVIYHLLKKKKCSLALLRLSYWLLHTNRKQVWLVSDRVDRADDNGKYFFEYQLKRKKKNIAVYYCISKASGDFENMRSIGPTLDMFSFRYRLFFLLSNRIISSHADEIFINPFGKEKKYVLDLFTFDFVFLQHGVTKDDQSDWLHRFSKNIHLFVTTAPSEYDSILSSNYDYNNKTVQLLGFPRYDAFLMKLKHIAPRKQILILPTWRKNLLSDTNQTAPFSYKVGFNATYYYHFYDSLINNDRLLKDMRTHGFKGLFALHPNYNLNYVDFHANDIFKVNPFHLDYQSAFLSSSMLITDYSSVAFDFAILKRPVLYSQFDRDRFFSQHIYKPGYFSYESDGFGPIANDLNETIEQIVSIIGSHCQMDDKYQRRVDSFYGSIDLHNSERVFNAILSMESRQTAELPWIWMPLILSILLNLYTCVMAIRLLFSFVLIVLRMTQQDENLKLD